MNLTEVTSSTDVNSVVGGVNSLSKTISDYGPLVVLLAVFLLVFILLVVLVLRSNSKMMKQIMTSSTTSEDLEGELLNKFVEGALATLTRENTSMAETIKASLEPLENVIKHMDSGNTPTTKNDDYHKDLVGAYIDVNMAFKDASRSALTSLNCGRVAIYMFHNGNASLLGLPFFKMTCIHEWTNRGNGTLRGKSHSDMPLHLFNDFIENLWNAGVYKSEDIEKSSHVDPSILEFTSFSNTKALYMIAIKDNDGVITGFVVAEFNDIDTFEHDETRNNEVYTVINGMIQKISPIVSNKYVFKNNKQ